MFIILKNDRDNIKSVVNIIYGDNVENFINTYLNDELEYLNSMNTNENENEIIEYDIVNNSIQMTKSMKNKGYLYNTYTKNTTIIISIEVIEYNPKFIEIPKKQNSVLWENLNSEINHRILKNMDKDSLYQIFETLDNNLKIKDKWSSNDFINILNDILKHFKKEYYSSIAKKLNRYKFKKESF
jgi:hypothetical protein